MQLKMYGSYTEISRWVRLQNMQDKMQPEAKTCRYGRGLATGILH